MKMKQIHKKITVGIVLTIGMILIGSCTDNKENPNGQKLFKLLSPERTHIDFSNGIVENEEFSVLGYNNMYMGGGVAIGDVNNDGLSDIFFTANQESNKLYLNKGNLKFEDVTEVSGIAGDTGIHSWSTGVTMVDINHDGWLDIYVCMVHGHKGLKGGNKLYINNTDGTFKEQAKEYGLDIKTYAHQAAFFDYDADGDLDMYLLNQAVHTPNAYRPGGIRKQRDSMSGDRLYNNKNQKFVDISEQAGIYGGSNGYGLALNIADFNNDNYPDIYVSNDFHENDYLYYNQKDGTFKEDIAGSMGHTSTFSMGNDVADVNNDGWMDIITLDMRPHKEEVLKTMMGVEDYSIYQFKINHSYHFQYARNMLQLNQGNLFKDNSSQFSEVGEYTGIASTDWSWGALFADFDLDGNKDLFVTNGIPHRPNDLDYINYMFDEQEKRGDLTFHERIATIPKGEVANIAYKNDGTRFLDRSKEWGLDLVGSSNGTAYGDLDNDGDLDLVVSNLNQKVSLYENTISDKKKKSNYLKVKFKGNEKNQFGIGARVTIETSKGRQVNELYPVKGWVSTVEPILLFGLDTVEHIDRLKVKWYDGREQVLQNIPSNQTLTLNQAQAKHIDSDAVGQKTKLFQNISAEQSGISFRHQENNYVDFEYEKLMPRMISSEGPKIAVADVNEDGLDDFYIGGAKNQAGQLYIQQENKEQLFFKVECKDFFKDRAAEDVDAAFLDVDDDGDMDLYVVSGGGESFQDFTQMDRLYINDGKGNYAKTDTHPQLNFNGSCAVPGDFNLDGNMDLFVGARSIPGAYGKFMRSRILLSTGKGELYDFTSRVFGNNIDLGMVTDAAWLENSRELIVVGEWMPVTILDFKNIPLVEKKMEYTNGWWNTIYDGDIDGDGDEDLLLGNMGINTNLKASTDKPVSLYLKDFDNNGSLDPILSYHKDGNEYPYYSLDELTNQLVELKKEYRTYKSYADSKFSEVFPPERLKGANRFQAFTFKSMLLENRKGGEFVSAALPLEMQMAPLYGFATADFNNDGSNEVLAAGNFYANQINIGKCDASYGYFMEKDNQGVWGTREPINSGFAIEGEVRDIELLKSTGGKKLVLVSRNNESLQLFSYE